MPLLRRRVRGSLAELRRLLVARKRAARVVRVCVHVADALVTRSDAHRVRVPPRDAERLAEELQRQLAVPVHLREMHKGEEPQGERLAREVALLLAERQRALKVVERLQVEPDVDQRQPEPAQHLMEWGRAVRVQLVRGEGRGVSS